MEKKVSGPLREKGQYALVFGVIALMLYAAGFPPFLLVFIGVLTVFIWKVFSPESRHETRRIFEFYLSAHEILREDDRRWYGFEIQETIQRGENILYSMSAAPPLVCFVLGALYQKAGDHSTAVKYLSRVIEDEPAGESAIVFPPKELRDYVQMLRKIERSPAEAPLTSAAVRSLERARKNKGEELLEKSRSELSSVASQLPGEQRCDSVVDMAMYRETEGAPTPATSVFHEDEDGLQEQQRKFASAVGQKSEKQKASPKLERKPISEVLHDIYDKNVQ